MAEAIVFIVAQDENLRRSLAQKLWHELDLHAVSMRGGVPVLGWARAIRPRLILLAGPPGELDGCALVAQLRQCPELAETSIVLMNSDGVAGRDRARQAGCDGFIAQPVVLADLVPLVQRRLASSPAANAAA